MKTTANIKREMKHRPIAEEIVEAYDVIPDLVLLINNNDEIEHVNHISTKKMGDNLIGEKLTSFIHSDYLDVYEKIRNNAFRHGHYGDTEIQIVTPAQDVLTGIFFLTRLKNRKNSSRQHVAVIIRDITEQRRTELQLLRFANAIHYAVNPLQITDVKGNIIYVNPAFERVFGFSKDELIGKDPNVVSSGRHSKKFWTNVWKTILEGDVWRGEIVNRNKAGELIYVELIISPIIDPSGKVVGFLGSHRDITEKRQLEEQLIRSQKMENIGTLAAGIAHEVGNPLTSISSLVQLIQRTTEDQFAHDKLELVKNQINRITKIIRELVDFSRPSQFEEKPTDINKLLHEAVNISRYGKKARHVKFYLELKEKIPLIKVVPDQLIQVFINIIINALDAIEREEGQISISTRVEKNSIFIVIKDTGKGIPEEHLDMIFDPFFTTKRVGQGTGLGLWVSYGIVKNFGGDINVDSIAGKGTAFTISIPVKN